MLKINYHKSFKKDVKIIKKRGYDISELEKVIDMLANELQLPEKYHNHYLKALQIKVKSQNEKFTKLS